MRNLISRKSRGGIKLGLKSPHPASSASHSLSFISVFLDQATQIISIKMFTQEVDCEWDIPAISEIIMDGLYVYIAYQVRMHHGGALM